VPVISAWLLAEEVADIGFQGPPETVPTDAATAQLAEAPVEIENEPVPGPTQTVALELIV
jgi:hypothetical protein